MNENEKGFSEDEVSEFSEASEKRTYDYVHFTLDESGEIVE